MTSRSPSPPTTLRSPPKESAISRLLIAPLTFISFLLSLALIDCRNQSVRTHFHSPPQPTTRLGRIKTFLHHCIYKRTSSSPYAYISESSSSTSVPRGKEYGKDEPWHWHTKQRKMMKAEFSDAYRIRNSVLVVMLAGVFVLGMGVAYGVVGAVSWVRFVWGHWEGVGMASLPMYRGGQGGQVVYGEELASRHRL